MYDGPMGTYYDRLMSLMLGTYLYIVGLRSALFNWYDGLMRRASRRVSAQTGGFFSENFLYLAVFSIPVAFLFFLLARKYIWPYAEKNIFPCFDSKDGGAGCFNDFGGDTFTDEDL